MLQGLDPTVIRPVIEFEALLKMPTEPPPSLTTRRFEVPGTDAIATGPAMSGELIGVVDIDPGEEEVSIFPIVLLPAFASKHFVVLVHQMALGTDVRPEVPEMAPRIASVEVLTA